MYSSVSQSHLVRGNTVGGATWPLAGMGYGLRWVCICSCAWWLVVFFRKSWYSPTSACADWRTVSYKLTRTRTGRLHASVRRAQRRQRSNQLHSYSNSREGFGIWHLFLWLHISHLRPKYEVFQSNSRVGTQIGRLLTYTRRLSGPWVPGGW
jgi:hypothetical protein